MSEYLYIGPRLYGVAVFSSDVLAGTTERHERSLDLGALTSRADPVREIDGHAGLRGVVIALATGLPDRARLDIAGTVLRRGLRVWLYWPDEQAIECVDQERLKSWSRHRRAAIALERGGRPLHRAMKSWERLRPGLRWI